ncbi:MAG: fibronectin type III domain-containing protein, partial [Ekhidna sp.]
ISNLEAGTQYYAFLTSINDSGESEKSEKISILTTPASPVFAIEGAVEDIGQAEATVTWEAPESSYEGYLLEVSTDFTFANTNLMLEGYGRGGSPKNLTQSISKDSIPSLSSGQTYFVRIRSFNSSGESPNSNIISFATVPKAPVFADPSNISQVSASVSWSTPQGAQTFFLDLNTRDDFDPATAVYENFPSAVPFEVISSLTPGTNYYVRVESSNNSGKSGDMNPVDYGETNFLTRPMTPEFSSGSTLTDVSQTGVTLNWNQVPETLDGYYVEVATSNNFLDGSYIDGFDNAEISKEKTSISVNNLEIGTEYYARLRSYNSTGSSQYSDVVSMLTLPETPTFSSDPFTNIGQSSATLSWNAVSEIFDGYHMELSTDASFIDESQLVDGYGANNITKVIDKDQDIEFIDDLTSGTVYYARLRSFNDSGESLGSEIISFKTISESPSFNSPSDITQEGAALSWSNPTGTDSFLLDVNTSDDFGSSTAFIEAESKTDAFKTLSGLENGTIYYARVESINESGGSGDVSFGEVSFLTKPMTPLFNSTGALTNISQTSMTINWNAVPELLDGYYLDVSTSSDFTSGLFLTGWENVDLTKDLTSISVNQLESGSSYYARLASYNASGSSSFSETILLLTTPGTPTMNEVTSIGQTEVDISWNEIGGADNYLLDVSQNFFQTLEPNYNALSVDGTSISIVGLNPGEGYQIRLRSNNASGESPNSETVEIITAPATPVARDATNSSTRVFTANWDAANGATYYVLEVSLDDFVTFHFNETLSSPNPIQITDLQSGATYKYRLRAGNASGESENSNQITVVAQNNAQSLSINNIDFDENFGESMSATTVTVSLTGGLGDAIVNWRHKKVLSSSSDWSELITASGSGTSFSFEVTDAMLDDVGVDFEVYATDNVTFVENLGNKIKRSFSESESSEIPVIALSKWQMISIPYELDDDLVTSVFNELGSSEYKKAWRLMRYEDGAYQDAITGFTRVELGKGYWFNAVTETSIKIGAGQANAEVPFKISLKEGWNQIGNPFNSPVNWTSVRNENNAFSSVEDLIVYNSDNNDFETSFTLSPFSGAFVWANEAVDELEIYPSSISGRIEAEPTRQASVEGDNWLLPLQLKIAGRSKEIAGVGMNNEATASKDQFDRLVPPRFEDYLEMYTSNHDFFYPYFSTDVVGTQDEYVWNFELNSNHASGMASLNWDNTPFKGQLAGLWLVDEKTGTIVEMASINSYSFSFSGKRSFSVHYSLDPNYEVLPSRLSLGDAFPNPAGESTQIPVLLPKRDSAYELELSVFDIQGRKITTIKEGSFEGGIYYFDWDFSSNADIKNGIYLYQLSIDNQSIQSDYKKILIRK